ncbi:hemin uptake protein HemP [Amantichitinum ursilacus]|uniref:Hemin uptake protein hemP n=1 Tax=Amantichitinum ursilacus TaxID=857265 RepID=A0A0N0GRD5_9NEIS|nr:hemin uptake protein HemP [Amantichitinum ursilacus]KPC55329.1 hypothetical protein WG78_01690 [Amantichitinum ursilacus]
MDTRRPHPSPTPATPASRVVEHTPVINSRDLLHAGHSVVIEHNGVRYTLRETRQSKLILTK